MYFTLLGATVELIADAEKYMDKLDGFLEKVINTLEDKLILIIFTIIIFLVGMFFVKIMLSIIKNILVKSKVDVILHRFVLSSFRITLIVLILITCASFFIPVTSLLTVLGAFGLAISLAVKDSLANIASGILILLTKPFTIKDYVDINGTSGIVSEIGLVYTILKTFDNQIIHIS
ncbi:MAG: mechanosensitive ion channel, partial [Oscillospiraceae bacterium]